MENIVYTSIGPVLHLNKAGELTQKRMKATKVCDGLYITEPDKTQFVKFIVEYNGVKWVEHQAPAANINPANMARRMPAILASIESGRLNELTDYHKELHRRIFNPDAPAIMELKKPERKKPAPLPEGAKATDTDAAITLPNEDINYMFYIKPKGAKRFSTYNPGKGTMNTGRVFTELYRKEHLPAVCKWIAEEKSGDFAYQLRSGDGKRIFWEHNPTAATPSETPQISTGTARIENVPTEAQKPVGTKIDEETRQYIISTYKTKENLTAKFSDAIGSIAMELEEYRANKRKGGRMRKENIRRLEEQIKLLYAQLNEWNALFDTSQSSESWQVVNYPTYAAKPRETARKEPKRTISKKERVYYPAWSDKFARYHFAHVHKMAFGPILAPPGYAPPIRGDCKIGVFQRAKPPNRIQYTKTNILQPP